ncbi:MAG: hypothetical protein A2Z99_08875 [Treponema sp. GWB1_62_6]|nr:MAG: hypothetical protein A2Y36_14080 [Treponema sp. GWA1_62_8]OHE65941.1 MAG: hypothetical protein A2001_15940 [Treponema sp. GWC1_61_84]OHE69769.1 MAG: hypothetical protein A2Z99_08875 [Treponema sp. GWB1_62_6]OHE73663.1 MAG: hypothetical protein A2413_10500 [Treponema sp. RIFOXYC1_FULL_61_9]HCM28218.1 hypothetical protein [Treponema sp.]
MPPDVSIFPWYQELYCTDSLTQGDILLECPIPILDESVYDALISGSEYPENPTGSINPDVIIMSQACDIEQEKIDSIVVCPLTTLSMLQMKNTDFSTKSRLESLRQGKEPALHLLNSYQSEKTMSDFFVVDFHHIFSLPKVFLRRLAISKDCRIRLLPPYREHLSQAFARYFMRVGLPVDIDRDALAKIREVSK